MKVKKIFDNVAVTWEVWGSNMEYTWNTLDVSGMLRLFDEYGNSLSFDLYSSIDKKSNVQKVLQDVNNVIDQLNKFAIAYAKAVNKAKAEILKQEEQDKKLFDQPVKKEKTNATKSKSQGKRKTAQAVTL